MTNFSEPSLFWQKLAEQHAADLDRYGLDTIKRHQALRYFTWRWSWGSLRESRQMRFLLAHSSPVTVARCLAAPADLSDEAWAGVGWTRRDRWLYVFATRLLWEYAGRHDTLDALSLAEPDLGAPLPVRWRDRLISQDLANTALEMTAIARALDGTQPRSIVEVGAGYGRAAYALLNVFPDATYTIVDIEPALSISKWYLGRLFPQRQLRFLRPDEAYTLPDGGADLVVSVSSLHEMTTAQVAHYLELFDDIADGGRVYLKQWQRWANPDDGITLDFSEYPIPRRWRPLFDEAAAVQTNFRQAAWCLDEDVPETKRLPIAMASDFKRVPDHQAPTYNADSLVVYNKSGGFLSNPRFRRAYNSGMDSGHHISRPRGSDDDIHIEWRIHVLLWAATHALRLPGDFVECGVNTGIFSLAVCDYTDFDSTSKSFWLFDTFDGIPADQMSEREREFDMLAESDTQYSECFDLARANFGRFEHANVVRGRVPEVLTTVLIDRVAYLSIDMNITEP